MLLSFHISRQQSRSPRCLATGIRDGDTVRQKIVRHIGTAHNDNEMAQFMGVTQAIINDLKEYDELALKSRLAQVEQVFRTLKTTRLKIRPLHVYRASRVRAHVFLCMLSYLVEIHLRAKLAPVLFHDDDKEAARQARSSPVAKAEVSAAAKPKAARKKTMDDLPVHSMTTLLAELGSMTLNEVVLPNYPEHKFAVMSEPVQKRVMELLGINKI